MAAAPRWSPLAALGDQPHVLVDAGKAPGTKLALSHWRSAGTPRRWWADTSTEICLRWLSGSRRQLPAEVVATDHLDQDGLGAAWALLNPEAAGRLAGPLVGMAEAGDFGVVGRREAARASFALATLADPQRSGGAGAVANGDLGAQTSLGEELLERLPLLLERTDHARKWWEEEDAFLDESLDQLARGRLLVEEVPEVDLAVVQLPRGDLRPASRFFKWERWRSHPGAIHSATSASALLLVDSERCELIYRYEGWVRLVSRPVAPRVDLSFLAEELQSQERGTTKWSFSGVSALVPRLAPDGPSSLSPETVRSALERVLRASQNRRRFMPSR